MQIGVSIARAFRWLWHNTDFIAKWVQILAIIVAGYWAYTRFLIKEKPTLEPRVEIATDLKDEVPGPVPGSCYVYLDLTLKNNGVSSFDTDGADIRAWRSPLSAIPSSGGNYIDPAQFKHGQQVVDLRRGDLLTMHFAPGESATRDFAWVFHPRRAAVYLFTVDIDAHAGATLKHIHAQTWSQTLCVGDASPSRRHKTRPQ